MMVRLTTSTPYAWPWDGRIDPARLAVLVVSPLSILPRVAMQVHRAADHLPSGSPPADREAAQSPAPSGAGDHPTPSEVFDSNAHSESDTRGLHGPQGQADHGLAQLVGAVVEAVGAVIKVACQTGEQPAPDGWLAAPQIDGFYDSRLDSHLRTHGRDQLLLVGSWLETTVHSTLRSANDRGYECLVVSDLCTSYQDDLRAGSLSCIEMSGGIFGAIDISHNVISLLTTHFPDRTAS